MTTVQKQPFLLLSAPDAARLTAQASTYILAGRTAEALAISAALDRWLRGSMPVPLRIGDGQMRPYSIVVVAHRQNPGQQALTDTLLALDPDRFELLFVENSADPIFDVSVDPPGGNVTLFRLGYNFGCSIARNVGMFSATGKGIILIDDDGQTSAGDIERLIATFERYDATIVRGKVERLTPDSPTPGHYDLGEATIQRFCDIEGFAILRREDVLRVGGFDPILYGHEGMELTARLYPGLGHEAFLYEPGAVLRHDYAVDETAREAKQARYAAIVRYCEEKTPGFAKLGKRFRMAADEPAIAAALRWRRELLDQPPEAEPASVIAVCDATVSGAQARALIDDLNRQRGARFEVVLVDGGGEATIERLATRLLSPGIPRRILHMPNASRAAMWNAALAQARHDLCLFADADVPMIPQRIAMTCAAHRLFRDAGLLGFAVFTEDHPVTAEQPVPFMPTALSVLAMLGNPAHLAALSLRRSRLLELQTFQGPDDEVAQDWLDRVLSPTDLQGMLLPVAVGFRAGLMPQNGASLARLARRHGNLVGDLASASAAALERLALIKATKMVEDRNQVRAYVARLERVDVHPRFDAALRAALHHRLSQIETMFFYDDQYRLRTARREISELRSDLAQALSIKNLHEAAQIKV